MTSYKFETASFDKLLDLLSKSNYSSISILVDENSKKYCLPILEKALSGKIDLNIIEIASGEINKNIESCQQIWTELLNGKADRNSLLINLGGGVITDMGGFAAMAYKRGIHFIHIPTTLLSMVDASIGGKLGIDFRNIKNAVGLFAEPRAVFIYPDFIKTLNNRELLSGFAEVIKHALIYDKSLWKYITSTSFENIDWDAVLKKSLQVKKEIVSIDPYEKSLRKILNFGHSIGHALESYFLETETPLKHGEAVALGMICEAYISTKILGLKIEKLDTITKFIRPYFDDVVIKEDYFPDILNFLEQDKKNSKGLFKFSLLKKIGKAEYDVEVSSDLIFESLRYYYTK